MNEIRPESMNDQEVTAQSLRRQFPWLPEALLTDPEVSEDVAKVILKRHGYDEARRRAHRQKVLDSMGRFCVETRARLEGETSARLIEPRERARQKRLHRKLECLHAWLALRYDPGRPLVIVVSVASVSLVACFLVMHWLVLLAGRAWWQLPPMAFLALVVLPAAVWIAKRRASMRALHNLSAPQYAEVTVRGRTPSEILRTLAWEIRRVCEEFLASDVPAEFCELAERVRVWREARARSGARVAGQAERLAEELRRLLNEHELTLKAHYERKRDTFQNQHKYLQRIEAMTDLAACQLKISPRHLREHIFGFRPDMYRVAAKRYVENWRGLLELYRKPQGPAADSRALGLLAQDRRFMVDLRGQAACQWQLLRYERLHEALCSYSSDPSTTGTLRYYVRAQSATAEWWGKALDRGEPASGFWEEVRFHHAKQRVHSGHDVHALAASICGRACERSQREDLSATGFNAERGRKLWNLLNRIPRDDRGDAVEDDVATLAQLRGVVDALLGHGRAETVENFGRVVEAWLSMAHGGPSAMPRLIVTHGYSKTVRDVLRENLDLLRRATGVLPRVLVLDGGDTEELDTVRMVHELEQELAPAGIDVTPANASFLLGLRREGLRVMFVLGAECFDAERRVLHPRGIATLLGDLKEKLQAKARVVVVAEGYKYEFNVSAAMESYVAHLDRVSIYRQDVVDIIASDGYLGLGDRGIIPEDWTDRVMETAAPSPAPAGPRA